MLLSGFRKRLGESELIWLMLFSFGDVQFSRRAMNCVCHPPQ